MTRITIDHKQGDTIQAYYIARPGYNAFHLTIGGTELTVYFERLPALKAFKYRLEEMVSTDAMREKAT
jgi:hypothetical protein